ncbi:unnamed protein product [Cyprideis torosa]|uniref:Uncharacterized protein n=1 Tax=Cyprideis torosa TaxID=163714 RepID=A0A7R8WRB5_9CRUS|nr:unnamed protein product [Cyprideis torosa]CAG0908648.1 unnamed protein product [Cyprideis torosa]
MAERMTLCNMAIEAGATSGICPPDRVTAEYLWPFIQEDYPSIEAAVTDYAGWHSDASATYEKRITLDVSMLQPQMTVGYKPDEVLDIASSQKLAVDQVYIGSCTNGRIEDLRAAAQILRGRTIAPTVRAILSPATPKVYSDAMAEGILKIFLDAGFCILNPTCGACLGMSSGVLAEGEVCASTTNRNFNGRMGKGGMVHLMSPYSAAAAAIAGYTGGYSMNTYGGPALFLDRDDINTDEIIPAKYLTEVSKQALKAHLLEDLLLDGKPFGPSQQELARTKVVVARTNFGCGSSREHAVWAFEVNDIRVVIAESFARIFRQNMFNVGILAIELAKEDIARLFDYADCDVNIQVDVEKEQLELHGESLPSPLLFSFSLGPFDRQLIRAGGWLAYADEHY